MKRRDIQRMARDVVDEIDLMRQEMAHQDAIIMRQAAQIKELKAALNIIGGDAQYVITSDKR